MEQIDYVKNIAEDLAGRMDNLNLENTEEYEELRELSWKLVHELSECQPSSLQDLGTYGYLKLLSEDQQRKENSNKQ